MLPDGTDPGRQMHSTDANNHVSIIKGNSGWPGRQPANVDTKKIDRKL